MTQSAAYAIAVRLAGSDDDAPVVRQHGRTIAAGILSELASPSPSVRELADIMRCGPTAAAHALARWRAIQWRERHAWLQLAEGRA